MENSPDLNPSTNVWQGFLENQTQYLWIFFGSFVGWHILHQIVKAISSNFQVYNKLSRFTTKQGIRGQVQWEVQILSFVHSLMAVYCSLRVWLLDGNNIASDPIYGYSPLAQTQFAITGGYFLWDLSLCLFMFQEFGFPFLVHASLCLIAYIFGLVVPFMHYYGAFFLSYEISTVFLDIQLFIENFGMRDSNFAVLNGMFFAGTFGIFRILFGTYYTALVPLDLLTKSKPSTPAYMIYFYISSCAVLTSLNYYWFFKIINRIMRTLKRKKN